MFGLFNRKPQAVQNVVEIETQAESNRDILRRQLSETEAKLKNIAARKDEHLETFNKNAADLDALKLRAIDLNEAISFATLRIDEATERNDASSRSLAATLSIHLQKAQTELSENIRKQEFLADKNAKLSRFLENLFHDMYDMEDQINNWSLKLTALEIREDGVAINSNLRDSSTIITDYKREVYTAEARAELSAGRH